MYLFLTVLGLRCFRRFSSCSEQGLLLVAVLRILWWFLIAEYAL